MEAEIKRLSELVEPLLKWYHKNARDLPWRRTNNPYHIWVAEIMLQQTRAEAVKVYYERFLSQLPEIADLARVQEEQLLKLWEGLGYYTRARNLQKAAKLIMTRFEGRVPSSYHELLSLPGIGEYTAGAIASEAFNLPVPAVDGNVLRIMTRILGDMSDISQTKTKRKIKEILAQIYPLSNCGGFTQSLMELGAVICIPNGIPKCTLCPAAFLCRAYRDQTTDIIPVKRKKAQRRIEERTVFLLVRDGRIAVRKRPPKGLLASLWELPSTEGLLTREDANRYLEHYGLDGDPPSELTRAKHVFTHIEWHMVSYIAECVQDGPEDFLWVTRDELEREVALPSAFRPFIRAYDHL